MAMIIIGLIAIIILIMMIRAVLFKPKKHQSTQVEIPEFDDKNSINNFRELLKCKTISYYDRSLEDDKEFEKFENLLISLYPNVNKTCEKIELGKRKVLYKWKGESSNEPTVLMSHYDVVPIEEPYWDKPAFDAILEDDVIWGRGTLDTKGTLCGIMEACEILIGKNFVPKNDVYIAFGGDEETNGVAQQEIISYMQANNICPGFVVDEGGAVVNEVFPGVSKPSAVIGIAEKGLLNVKFESLSNGGHASAPPPSTPITKLATAVNKVHRNPFKTHLTMPVKEMFDTLGRHSTFGYKILFANLWITRPILNYICTKKGGELNSLMRTSLVFTQMEGSKAPNVIPPVASVSANLRLMQPDTISSAIKYLESTVGNKDISITKINGTDPSPISKLDCKQWDTIKNVVQQTWTDAVVSPYLMIAASDARHYSRICDYVYRFSAMEMTGEERGSIHGHNEKIKVETFTKVIDFYLRLVKSI